MDVISVDLGDVWVRHNYEWEVAEGLNAVGEASREDGESEVGGREELLRCERWSSMPDTRINQHIPELNSLFVLY